MTTWHVDGGSYVDSAEFSGVGLTYRQVDYWTRMGYLQADEISPGSGRSRRWSLDEVQVARGIQRLQALGFELEIAAGIARRTGVLPRQISLDPRVEVHQADEGPTMVKFRLASGQYFLLDRTGVVDLIATLAWTLQFGEETLGVAGG